VKHSAYPNRDLVNHVTSTVMNQTKTKLRVQVFFFWLKRIGRVWFDLGRKANAEDDTCHVHDTGSNDTKFGTRRLANKLNKRVHWGSNNADVLDQTRNCSTMEALKTPRICTTDT